jgi:hypothetical protein
MRLASLENAWKRSGVSLLAEACNVFAAQTAPSQQGVSL